ncbi:MAG: hypothetical protein KC656_19890, partial [Myxococcales bacterium]|nr:hypothetical protein [Myxococcales bacterium]
MRGSWWTWPCLVLSFACAPAEVRPDLDDVRDDTGGACPPPVRGLSFTMDGRVVDDALGQGLGG